MRNEELEKGKVSASLDFEVNDLLNSNNNNNNNNNNNKILTNLQQ